jgi:hypothetical protein
VHSTVKSAKQEIASTLVNDLNSNSKIEKQIEKSEANIVVDNSNLSCNFYIDSETKSTISLAKNEDKIDWNESNVERWLADKEINPIIVNNVKPCNGLLLYELYYMLNNAPEFFYSSITSYNSNVPTRDAAKFSYELKKLFLDNKLKFP